MALGVAGEMAGCQLDTDGVCWGSAIMGEIALSQVTGTWRRMKQCQNPTCRATFYDSSWNNRSVCRLHPATSVTQRR